MTVEPRPALRRFLMDRSAATAAEFALVVPVFLLIVFGTINTAITMSAIIQMHYAAERAARCLSVNVTGACTAANVDTYAKTFYNGPAITGLTFTRTTPVCGNKVVGTGTYEMLTGFSSTSVNLSASACYPVI
ncbi:MAG TPA: TadE/TadG family type IV pilus assembly protein [Novosphingobium sp.]